MKKIIGTLLTALLFLGCNSKATTDAEVEPKIVIGKSLSSLKLNDQNEKAHTIDADTKLVIFTFAKDAAHTCNNFFDTKIPSYLHDNKTQFIADVSGAPSLIRSMFIIPGLKDFKHTVMILDDKDIASSYKAGVDAEKIILVKMKNKLITDIKTITTTEELKSEIENN
jgi:hypothetical protein